MTTLVVPPFDDKPWPTLGPLVRDFIEDRCIFGPGSLKGQPATLSPEKLAVLYRMYEVYPKGHAYAGRRRFKRVGISWRKGTAKTEFASWIAFAELHPEGPVRSDGFDAAGDPVGVPVRDPYIPMVAYTQEQVEELAYGALYVVVTDGPDADLFDAGLDRIIRLDSRGRADGRAVALAGSPNARDGARTTFQHFDEPVSLTSMIPTIDGWKSMADIAVGDLVFGREGTPIKVVGKSDVKIGRSCYRVTFNDGNSVVADATHPWTVIEWSNRPVGEQVVSTEHMLRRGLQTAYGARWRLPRSGGFDGCARRLPIDPYLLGLWLGDGASAAGYIHSHLDDMAELSAGIDHGLSTTKSPHLVRWLPKGLRKKLRRLGVLGGKRIPDQYLFASRKQRMALLQGLMDTDGHTTVGGACTFVQGRHELAEQVAVLVRSLGAEASVNRRPDARSRTGEMCKVHFSPGFRPFRLSRKAERFDWRQRKSTTRPAIVSIEPVESEPVQCIAVDSDDHLFLIGRGLHLTHNTHRMHLPSLLSAHETMMGNLPKRPLEDPWSLSTTTAGQPGQGSVAEGEHREGIAISEGEIAEPDLFYFHREAGPGHDLETLEGRIAAISEATGAEGEYGPGQFRDIAKQWDRPGSDKSYLERVWLNRWVRSASQAFDLKRCAELYRSGEVIPAGAFVTGGFDGARFRDATGIVVTDIVTGLQELWAGWERPLDLKPEDPWECPEAEVTTSVDDMFDRFEVWQFYCDPPHWTETVGSWATNHPDQVSEWWTNRLRPMAFAVRAYREAMDSAAVSFGGTKEKWARFERHLAGAGTHETQLVDDEGKPLSILQKLHQDRKFDYAMAGCLSWRARLDALLKGAHPKPKAETYTPFRIY